MDRGAIRCKSIKVCVKSWIQIAFVLPQTGFIMLVSDEGIGQDKREAFPDKKSLFSKFLFLVEKETESLQLYFCTFIIHLFLSSS